MKVLIQLLHTILSHISRSKRWKKAKRGR